MIRIPRPYFGIQCGQCGPVPLIEEERERQMRSKEGWKCPRCGGAASWDEQRYRMSLRTLEAFEYLQEELKEGGSGGDTDDKAK
jgi:hypothetical protein